MSTYQQDIAAIAELRDAQTGTWNNISPEYAARMKAQNRFKSGLDIARYTAAIMRKDMAEYDADSSQYTQSLGCWHGFIGQQKLLAIKKHHGTTNKRYLYLSGWMISVSRNALYLCARSPASVETGIFWVRPAPSESVRATMTPSSTPSSRNA